MLESLAVDLRNMPIGMCSNHPAIGVPKARCSTPLWSGARRQQGRRARHRSPPSPLPGLLARAKISASPPESWTRAGAVEARVAKWARIVLMAAEGRTNCEVAEVVDLHFDQVGPR